MSPEQSNPFPAVPPQTYGVPRASSAVRTTSAALPVIVVGGSGGGRREAGRAPPIPPPASRFPRPTLTPIAPLNPVRASEGRQKPRGPRSSTRERASTPSAKRENGRHSSPPPLLHWAAGPRLLGS